MDTLPPELAFRRSRDGYDRTDVDRYVHALVAERDDLRNRVAELESTIDATADYLRSRRGRREAPPPVVMPPAPPPAPPAIPSSFLQSLRYSTLRTRRAMQMTGAACAIAVAAFAARAYRQSPAVGSLATAAGVVVAAAASTATGVPATAAAPVATPPTATPLVEADHVVALATATTCWIAIGIDGQPRIERVLHRDEQFSVHWSREIVLRVGDASAVSVKINGRLAKPLGPAGQPVTVRITPANFEQFVAPAAP